MLIVVDPSPNLVDRLDRLMASQRVRLSILDLICTISRQLSLDEQPSGMDDASLLMTPYWHRWIQARGISSSDATIYIDMLDLCVYQRQYKKMTRQKTKRIDKILMHVLRLIFESNDQCIVGIPSWLWNYDRNLKGIASTLLDLLKDKSLFPKVEVNTPKNEDLDFKGLLDQCLNKERVELEDMDGIVRTLEDACYGMDEEDAITYIQRTLKATTSDTPLVDQLSRLNLSNKLILKPEHFLLPNEATGETVNIEQTRMSFIGYDSTLRQLHDALLAPMLHPHLYAHFLPTSSDPIPRGILVYGPPGVGKTTLLNYFLEKNAAWFDVVRVQATEMVSKYIGEGEAKLRQLFDSIRLQQQQHVNHGHTRQLKHVVIVMEDLDVIASKRDSDSGSNGGSNVTSLLTTLLLVLDAVDTQKLGCTLIGTTIRPDCIDSALIRPGRLGQLIYMPRLQSAEETVRVFEHYCDVYGCTASDAVTDEEREWMVGEMKGWTVADVQVCVRLVARMTSSNGKMDWERVIKVMDRLKRRVSDEIGTLDVVYGTFSTQ